MQAIDLCCPYCGEIFAVQSPPEIEQQTYSIQKIFRFLFGSFPKKTKHDVDRSEKEYSRMPHQVYCLPYTRDIGKFDPKPEDDILSANCWSDQRIGKDYLSFINFERFGILRIAKQGVNVRYRVQRCVKCQNLFDVFANYTVYMVEPETFLDKIAKILHSIFRTISISEKKSAKTLNESDNKTLDIDFREVSFEEIWPHLFEMVDGNTIKLYRGENLIIRLLRTLGSRLNSNTVGAFLLGMIIFFVGWLPYLFTSSEILKFRSSAFLANWFSNFSSAGLIFSTLNLDKPATMLIIITFILYFVISIGIMILLLYFDNYLSYIRNSPNFADLFLLKKPNIGLNFWKNYTSSRFVGVQRRKGFLPQLTQSDVFAGGIAILLAIVLWINYQSPEFLRSIAQSHKSILLFYIFELIVWLAIIYLLSIGIYLSLSLTSYVLNGIQKIPMSLTPHDNFLSSKPLRVLEKYAINMMLVIFVIVVAILSTLQIFLSVQWILVWFELALAFLFIAMGLGTSRNEYIIGALLYLFCLYALGILPPIPFSDDSLLRQGVYYQISHKLIDFYFLVDSGVVLQAHSIPVLIPIVDLRVLLLGFFLTSALAFQIFLAEQYINNLIIESKNYTIKKYREQLDALQKNLDFLDDKINSYINAPPTLSNTQILNNYQSQRNSVLSSIHTTVNLISQLDKIAVKQNSIKNIAKALTPLMTSFVWPLLLNLSQDVITKQLDKILK